MECRISSKLETANNDKAYRFHRNAPSQVISNKKGTVTAKPWYTNVRVQDDLVKDKYKMVSAQAGYAIRNGQTITTRIIVIVPKGERPKMNCRIIYLQEIQ